MRHARIRAVNQATEDKERRIEEREYVEKLKREAEEARAAEVKKKADHLAEMNQILAEVENQRQVEAQN